MEANLTSGSGWKMTEELKPIWPTWHVEGLAQIYLMRRRKNVTILGVVEQYSKLQVYRYRRVK